MTYLLDTHVWVWMHTEPELLSARCREVLLHLKQQDKLCLSAISIWEVCKLVEKGKITLYDDLEAWIEDALDVPGLRVIPLDLPVFLRSTTLPQPFHDDPSDQMIVATARLNTATILTKDKHLHDYPHVKTLW